MGISDATTSMNEDTALIRVPPSGDALVLAKATDILPGQTTEVTRIAGSLYHQSAFSDSGDVLFNVILEGFVYAMYLNDTLLAQAGEASPIPGRTWSGIPFRSVDLSSAGDYVYHGVLNGDVNTNLTLIRNGAKFRQRGDSLPATAPYAFTGFGFSSPAFVDANERVCWIGHWDNPNPDRNEGLFVEDELLVEEGVTTVGGVVLTDLAFGDHSFFASDNGRYVVFQGTLANGQSGMFLLDLDLGTPYCAPLVPNSTGQVGRIAATGSDVVSATGSPLLLAAHDLPPGQFGYFLASRTQASLPGSGGSKGTLCLGGDLARLRDQVTTTGRAGYLQALVDTLAIPTEPSVPILAGETRNFQCWHRDKTPTPTSNFTDAVAVTFQ